MKEAGEQAALMKWTLMVRDRYPELKLLHHIPNGGARDPIEGRHLKAQGVKRGVPDLCLPVARGRYHGLYIEIKTADGKPTMEQRWWVEQLNAQGYFADVRHGWEAAKDLLEWYLNLEDGHGIDG